MTITEKINKLTGIPLNKLNDVNVIDIIKDNNILTNITDLQRNKLAYIKDLLYYINEYEFDNAKKITCSNDIFDLMKHISLESVENFYVILLRRNNTIIKREKISFGGTAGTVVDVKVIAQLALTYKANSVILCHNHPSGNVNPSQSDIQLTKKVKDGLQLLDITVLDHIIISNNKSYSLADNCDM